MKFLDFFKANVNRNNSQNFFDLEKKYNEVLLQKDQAEAKYNDLKNQFDQSLVSLFIGESEVSVGQRNFYFLIAVGVIQIITFIVILIK